jgi:hypothetical protein
LVVETGLRWSQSLNVADSVARGALQRGISVIVPWVLSDALFHYAGTAADRSARAGDRALLIVPVMARSRALGVLAVADRCGRVFGDSDLAVAERLARSARRAFDPGEPADRHGTIVRDGLAALGGQSAALYALTGDGERLMMVAGCHA